MGMQSADAVNDAGNGGSHDENNIGKYHKLQGKLTQARLRTGAN